MIHPTAIVDPGAEVAEGVEIGPYSIIEAGVRIGPGCVIGPHVVIQGPTELGANNRIYQYASIGANPQDKKYAGEPTRLRIGDGNTIREFVTINRGTAQDLGETRIGDDNWIMANVHIAHDCEIGNHTIFANNASLAGHVEIADYVILGGYSLVHQFCRLGIHSFTAFAAGVDKDVPPYVMAAGYRAEPRGINSEGMKRRGFDPQAIRAVRNAYRILYRSGLGLQAAIEALRAQAGDQPALQPLLAFLEHNPRGERARGILR